MARDFGHDLSSKPPATPPPCWRWGRPC
jgi:hypothetical protein